MDNIKVENPIDLATGSGRTLRDILESIRFRGQVIGVDSSKSMCDFLEQDIRRSRLFTNKIQIVNASIVDLPKKLDGIKTNFVISSFGFPSSFTDKQKCLEELAAVHNLLLPKGILVTIGWDESFNDELNYMWYKFIPDDINAFSFEDWRRKRSAIFTSPRNCNLMWLRRNVRVPLQFVNIEESAYVMGHLFGREAARYVVESQKLSWEMSYGITYNTKEEINNILDSDI